MESTQQIGSVSKPALWTSRILTVLLVLFFIFDGGTKVIKEPHVMAAGTKLGFSAHSMVVIGWVLLICTLIYIIPRTSILGAILLTGYLGGATAINVHVHDPLFETIFPVIFGILVWLALFLRDRGIRAMTPLRK